MSKPRRAVAAEDDPENRLHHVGGWYPFKYWQNMRRLKAETGKDVQVLFGEMMLEWFARYGLPMPERTYTTKKGAEEIRKSLPKHPKVK